MELVFREYRISLTQAKDPLPPSDDVVEFDVRTNTKDLEKIIKVLGCPSDLQDKVKEVVTDYCGVFCEHGFLRTIRGFSFQIDTDNHPPTFYKPPRYGPHESKVMQNLLGRLDENSVVEEEGGPWGALVFIYAKPHQENMPWHE